MMKLALVFSFITWSITCSSCLITTTDAFCPSFSNSQKSSTLPTAVRYYYYYDHHEINLRNNCGGPRRTSRILLSAAAATSDDDNDDTSTSSEEQQRVGGGVRNRMRKSVTSAKERVKRLVTGSLQNISEVEDVVLSAKGGQPIAEVLADAAISAAEMAAEEVRSTAFAVIQRTSSRLNNNNASSSGGKGGSKTLDLETQAQIEADAVIAMDSIMLAKTSVADAFDAAEMALTKIEDDIARARNELESAKRDATLGLAVAEKAAAEAAMKARFATESAFEEVATTFESNGGVAAAMAVGDGQEGTTAEAQVVGNEEKKMEASVAVVSSDAESSSSATTTATDSLETIVQTEAEVVVAGGGASSSSSSDYFDVSSLKYEDVDYTLTDMAPPFINEDECLVPGEPVVRVEKAPQNSRRIFAGIDIPVSVDEVWNLLTDYPNLQKVVPNLVVNEVLELYPGIEGEVSVDTSLSDAEQCKAIATHMKGAILKQVGGAKVVGINFSARTTLEVREWPSGMPDFAHYEDEIYQGKSRGNVFEKVRDEN